MPRKKSELAEALRQSSNQNPLGYQQCEWLAGDERCRYPGSISTNTHEGGPYFCRLHFGCDDGHWGATIVEASRDYIHPTQAEILAEHTEKAKAALAERGLTRREGESTGDWSKRLRTFMKQSAVLKDMRDAA